MFREAQHWNLSPVNWFYPALWHPISPKYNSNNCNNILLSVLHLFNGLVTFRSADHKFLHTHTHLSSVRAVCPAHLVRVHNVFSRLILNDLCIWSNNVKWFNNKTSDLVWVCAGLQSDTHLHTESTYTHQMLCCRITTLTFTFLTNFKISKLNKEHKSSLKMIWIRSKHVGAFLSILMWTF